MVRLTNHVREQVLEAQSRQMRLIRETSKKCRCEAIQRAVRRNGIKTIMALHQCSKSKASEQYDETFVEGLDACCVLCCTCHIEKHVEENRPMRGY